VIRFVLASASPARYETLVRAGVRPEVIVSDVDERGVTADDTADLVAKLAAMKAFDVAERLSGRVLVLGCDSLLELDGEPFGKPGTVDEARKRWRRLRGREGRLLTGHCLVDRVGDRVEHATVGTDVRFADVTDEEIETYLSTGEAVNVAGGFTIDGLGGWFVDGVLGDPHNVVGLSLPMLRKLLHNAGYALTDIGYPSG
jgi:septum formation protein